MTGRYMIKTIDELKAAACLVRTREQEARLNNIAVAWERSWQKEPPKIYIDLDKPGKAVLIWSRMYGDVEIGEFGKRGDGVAMATAMRERGLRG